VNRRRQHHHHPYLDAHIHLRAGLFVVSHDEIESARFVYLRKISGHVCMYFWSPPRRIVEVESASFIHKLHDTGGLGSMVLDLVECASSVSKKAGSHRVPQRPSSRPGLKGEIRQIVAQVMILVFLRFSVTSRSGVFQPMNEFKFRVSGLGFRVYGLGFLTPVNLKE
jgi:hypothetical protein